MRKVKVVFTETVRCHDFHQWTRDNSIPVIIGTSMFRYIGSKKQLNRLNVRSQSVAPGPFYSSKARASFIVREQDVPILMMRFPIEVKP